MAVKVLVTSQPAAEPLSLVEIREHLRVGFTDDDNRLNNALLAARQWLEGKMGRALITQTLRSTFDLPLAETGGVSGVIGAGPLLAFELPYAAPLQSVESVQIETDLQTWRTLTETTDYIVDDDYEPARVFLRITALSYWAPSIDVTISSPRVRVAYIAGFGDAGRDVPYGLRQAILAAISFLYENPDMEIPDDILPTRHLVISL